MGSNRTPMMTAPIMVLTLVCAAIILSGDGALLLLPSVFAQQEEISLGEEESIASSITSDILDGSNIDDDEDDNESNDEE